ncbi:hypothetical protein [Mycolicibacterium sp.]|uniref:hypothetical protein n=1 Tax=Mycolicibacterium sp. TaxID=2320850 RepID=UPI0037C61DA1
MMSVIDLDSFLAERSTYLIDCDARPGAVAEFGSARMYFETTDGSTSLSGCRQWRGCLRMSALDAPAWAPDIEVGVVEFLILRAGYESPAEVLPLFGDRATNFAELFDAQGLDPELDESDDFTGGMPISTALLILDATLDDRIDTKLGLRAWAVTETIHTMLPTTAGAQERPPDVSRIIEIIHELCGIRLAHNVIRDSKRHSDVSTTCKRKGQRAQTVCLSECRDRRPGLLRAW